MTEIWVVDALLLGYKLPLEFLPLLINIWSTSTGLFRLVEVSSAGKLKVIYCMNTLWKLYNPVPSVYNCPSLVEKVTGI